MTYRNVMLIVFIYLTLFWINLAELAGNENEMVIYEIIPKDIMASNINQWEQQAQIMRGFSLNNLSYLIIGLQNSHVFLYDITNTNSAALVWSIQLHSNGEIVSLNIIVTSIWITFSSGTFIAYSLLALPLQIQLISQSYNQQKIVQLSVYPQNSNRIILLCSSEIQLFTLTDNKATASQNSVIPLSTSHAIQVDFIKSVNLALIGTQNQGIQSYQMQSSQNNDSMTYVCTLQISSSEIQEFILINESTLITANQNEGIFMYSLESFISSQGQNCQQNKFVLLSQTSPLGKVGSLILSQNQDFLYVYFQVNGIFIFDISKSAFQVFQNISPIKNCLNLSLDDNSLYCLQSDTVLSLNRIIPNLNIETPNLLLNNYQLDDYPWTKEGHAGYVDYSCLLIEEKNILITSRSYYGMGIYSYQNDGILEEKSYLYRSFSYSPTMQVVFWEDNIHAYLIRANLGISIIDLSDFNNPVIIKEMMTLNQQFAVFNFFYFFNNYQNAIITNNINCLILSTLDPYNPSVISVIDTMTITSGATDCYRLVFSEDEKHMILQLFNFGMVVIDITNIKQPVVQQIINTYNAIELKQILNILLILFLFFYIKGLLLIKRNNNNFTFNNRLVLNYRYGVLTAGYKGLIIFEIDQEFRFTQISSVSSIMGTATNVEPIYSDQFVLVSSFEFPMLSLVNIKNIYKPFLYQQFVPNSSVWSFYNMCVFKDQSQSIQLGQYTTYLLQLRSNMIIQTEIYQINSSNQYKIQQKNTSLKVGGNYAVYIVPLYQSKVYKIVSQKYYRDFEYQPLPNWMQFIHNENKLTVSVTKESLQSDKFGNIIEGNQQIILLTMQQVLENEFINTYLNIVLEDSIAIFNACLDQGIIDNDGFINQTYNPQKNLNLGVNQQLILSKWISATKQRSVMNFIHFKLNKNMINQVISFNTVSSLVVTMTETTMNISSINDDITVILTLQNNQTLDKQQYYSKFVSISYPNILSYFSTKQDQLTIQGKLSEMNEILSKGILFYQDPNSFNQTLIVIRVFDNVNYDYVQLQQPQNLSFITPLQQIALKLSLSLQDDLNLLYPGGGLSVSEIFIYQINNEIYTYNKKLNLIFDVKILTKGQFQEIPQNFWLQYRSSDRVLIGTPSLSDFKSKIIIQVNATDGYSYVTQQFQISIDYIPFNVILQIFIQILGPILGLLGLYKYCYILINYINRKSITYCKETVYAGREYQKQIVITGNIKRLALKMWDDFLLRSGKQNINKIIKNQSYIYQSDKSISFQRQIFQQYNNQTLKNISREEQILIERIIKEYKEHEKKGQSFNSEKDQSFNLFNVNGNINIEYILKEIKDQQQVYAKEKYFSLSSQYDLNQLDNTNSLISKAIYSVVVSYVIKQDPIIRNIQQWLSLTSQKQKQYKLIDWYKAYLYIKPQCEQVSHHPYPLLEINEESFNSAISEILYALGSKSNFQFQSEQYFQFVISLLKEGIIASALGFFENNIFQKATQGESIHCKQHEIKKIVSYQKLETFAKVHDKTKKVELTFQKKSLCGNNLLPSWITSVDIVYGVLIIKGTPQKQDTGDILIEVIDTQNIVLRRIQLSIVNYDNCDLLHLNFSSHFKNTQLLRKDKFPFHSERQIKNRQLGIQQIDQKNRVLQSAKIISLNDSVNEEK